MPLREDRVNDVAAFARDLFGDAYESATVLPAGGHLKVHLRPLPVVARVASFSGGPSEYWHALWARELEVARHLHAAGVPAIGPTDLADPGPHRVGDTWVSLWKYVEIDRTRVITAADLHDAHDGLHDALSTFPEPLPDFLPWNAIDPCRRAVEAHGKVDAQLEEVFAYHQCVGARVAELPPHKLVASHGDGHPGNLLCVGNTWTWCDFEDVSIAPTFWDTACAVSWTVMYGWQPLVTEELVQLRLGSDQSRDARDDFDLALMARLVYHSVVGMAMTLQGFPTEDAMRPLVGKALACLRQLGTV